MVLPPHRRAIRPLLWAALAGSAALTAVTVNGGHPAQAAASNDPTCATAIEGTPGGSAGAPATGYALNVGGASDFGTVWDPPGNPQVMGPTVTGVDIVGEDGQPSRRLLVRFAENLDVGAETPVDGRVVSPDGGATWPADTYTHQPTGTRLRDGSLLAFGFKPIALNEARTKATFARYRSTDEGTSWMTGTSTFDLGASMAPTAAPRTHGSVLELADGTLLVSIYGVFTDAPGYQPGVPNYRSQVQASTDGGTTFVRRGVIANSDATHAYPEAAIATLPNGTLLSVVRHHVSQALATPGYTTSIDGGATWAAPRPLSVSFPNGYDPYDDATHALLGIYPQLKLMPNGVMVLRAGRPDNWVAISTNGQGTGWVGQLTYRNCPTNGYRLHGSTGNGGLENVASNRLIVVGDNCENTWSCDDAGETGFTVDKQNRIWRRYVDVLTPDVGKIDLATRYRDGRIVVDGDMTSTVAGHPRTRVAGAFDGSTEYWSSAVRAGGSGTFVIRLDRRYSLTRIGLSLRNGRTASGQVFTSIDGQAWNPIVAAAGRTHYALEYFPLATPVPANYVKVTVDASSDCGSALGDRCAFLNELELYSTVDSFENDPVNNRPRGYRDITASWVTRYALGANDSASALRITDNDEAAQSTASWIGSASRTKTLEFRLNPVAMPNSFLFDVLGRDATGGTVAAYHFAVYPDGGIARWSGDGWQRIGAANLVTVGTWQTVRVSATTTAASVTVDGTTVASGIAPSVSGAAALVGHRFASAGTKQKGGNFLVDDVLFTG